MIEAQPTAEAPKNRGGRPRKPEALRPVNVSVKMDPALYDKVAQIAVRTDVSVNHLMNSAARLLLWHYAVSGSQKTPG